MNLTGVVDVLERTKNGLEWYQGMHPEHNSPEDDDMHLAILEAIEYLKSLDKIE